MCKIVEDMLEEAILKERRKMAVKMIEKGNFSFEDIAALCELTIEEVEALANKKSA